MPIRGAGGQERRGARSYARLPTGGAGSLLREFRGLYAGYTSWSADEHVDTVLGVVRQLEERVLERYSMVIEDLDVLDIGTGPHLIQLQHFAQRNRVVGIDLDVVALGLNPMQYLAMLRTNGAGRTLKTMVRKALGIDIRHARAVRARLGRSFVVPVRQMDVCALEFEPATFDFGFCSSLLHHLPDPGRALDEIGRVLRPGGVACVGLQLYTSETGSRDPELIRVARSGGPAAGWPHLRSPGRERTSLERVNGLRLGDWLALFERHWPGSNVVLGQPERTRLEPLARDLQAQGELLEFSIEELITHDLWFDWQKPVDAR